MVDPRIIGAGLVLAATFGTGWATRGWHEAALRESDAKARAEAQKIIDDKADASARDHEAMRAALAVQQRVVTKEVAHVVEKPIYRNVCLDDDGLRVLNAAVGAASVSEPAPALPAPAAPQ